MKSLRPLLKVKEALFSLFSNIDEQKVMIAVYALISLPFGVLLFEYHQVNDCNIWGIFVWWIITFIWSSVLQWKSVPSKFTLWQVAFFFKCGILWQSASLSLSRSGLAANTSWSRVHLRASLAEQGLNICFLMRTPGTASRCHYSNKLAKSQDVTRRVFFVCVYMCVCVGCVCVP